MSVRLVLHQKGNKNFVCGLAYDNRKGETDETETLANITWYPAFNFIQYQFIFIQHVIAVCSKPVQFVYGRGKMDRAHGLGLVEDYLG